jgi:hypothetical protein
MAIMNKRGTSLTNPMTLLIVVVVFGLLTFAFFNFARQLSTNDNNNLNDESIIYIATHNGFEIEDKQIGEGILSEEDLESAFYVQGGNATSSDKDQALEFLYYREQSIGWRGIANSIYNFPTYVISTVGLDLQEWAFVQYAWDTIAWGIIFFVIFFIVRGIKG